MVQNDGLVVFQSDTIRRTWFNNEWWFVAVDIIEVLTDSKNPSGYLKDMRRRDSSFDEGWRQIATPLAVKTNGGMQHMNCVSTKGAFRLVQSIPSKKAEPFKVWLAQVGYERVLEIENPELAQERMKNLYEAKGYPKEWIDKRLRGIAIRQELTDEWKNRDIKTKEEFSILTNEITKATFGKTVGEYKEFKRLQKQNLRDNMTDWELILTMFGEKATTDITKERNAKGFVECKDSANTGGNIAKRAREDLESNLGKSIISEKNMVDLAKNQKID